MIISNIVSTNNYFCIAFAPKLCGNQHSRVHLRTRARTQTHTHIHTHTHTHWLEHAHTHTHTRPTSRSCVHARAHTQIPSQRETHTHIHVSHLVAARIAMSTRRGLHKPSTPRPRGRPLPSKRVGCTSRKYLSMSGLILRRGHVSAV